MGIDVVCWRVKIGLFRQKGKYGGKDKGRRHFDSESEELLKECAIVRKKIKMTLVVYMICSMLLILSGDVELNPGPITRQENASTLARKAREISAKMSMSPDYLHPLHLAVFENNISALMRLLRDTGSVDVEQLAQSPLTKNICFGTAMHLAAGLNNIAAAKVLLSYGADVNSQNAMHVSPLHWAILYGQVNITEWLIKHGADIHQESEFGHTPLHMAIDCEHLVIAGILLSNGANINCRNNRGWTPLHNAGYNGQVRVVKWLLDNGANVHMISLKCDTALNLANRRGNMEAAVLIQNYYGKYPPIGISVSTGTLSGLHQAVCDNDLLTLKRLLTDRTSDLELLAQHPSCKIKCFGSAMHFAAFIGNIPAAEALLAAGANINSLNAMHVSPLQWAIFRGQVDMALWLIKHGADIFQESELGHTPLHMAIEFKHIVIAEILLLSGADINCWNTIGWTSLHNAAHTGQVHVIKWLLDNGADVHIRSLKGDTAFDIAVRRSHTEAAFLLQDNSNHCGHISLYAKKEKDNVAKDDTFLLNDVGINNTGRASFHAVANNEEVEMAEWFVDDGDDEQMNTLESDTNLQGHTELALLVQTSIQNGNAHREILMLKGKFRRRRNSNASTNVSATSLDTIDHPYMSNIDCQGVALIINNEDFSSSGGMLTNRDGSEHDKEKLCTEFRQLGFDMHCFDDLSADEMLNCFSYYSSLDHEQYTCFVCCILTHGSEGGKIFGVDGRSLTPLQVTSGFVAATCPSLAGKPKAFVIVACKGNNEAEADMETGVDGASLAGEANQRAPVIDVPPREKDLIPLQEEDFLVAFSAIPDHVSYRKADFGTAYVNSFSRNLSKYGGRRCFADILRNTEKHLLKQVIRGCNGRRMKQVCCKMDTLKRPFCLKTAWR